MEVQTIVSRSKKHKIPKGTLQFNLGALQRDAMSLLYKFTPSKTKKIPLERKLLNLLFSNYLVNCVTDLELFHKNLVLIINWPEENYSALLKEKVSLTEAYSLIQRGRISKQQLVVHYSSFQNFEAVSSVFNVLTDKKFYNEVESVQNTYTAVKSASKESGIVFDPNDTINLVLKNQYPDWRTTLLSLYEKRNKFVHEGIVEKYSQPFGKQIMSIVTAYKAAVNTYLYNNFKPTRKV